MAEYVVDASVVAERLVRGPYTPNAQAFFSAMTNLDRLIVPEFTWVECTSVIWKHLRFQGMTKPHARQLLTDLMRLPLEGRPTKELVRRTLSIALDNKLAVYDSVYVAMALSLNIPLITIDQKQEQAARAESVTIKPITDFKP